MVWEVVSDSSEIVRHIIREEIDSQNHRTNYGKVGRQFLTGSWRRRQ